MLLAALVLVVTDLVLTAAGYLLLRRYLHNADISTLAAMALGAGAFAAHLIGSWPLATASRQGPILYLMGFVGGGMIPAMLFAQIVIEALAESTVGVVWTDAYRSRTLRGPRL